MRYETDIAIIGSGAAGVCAALEARAAGARTVLLEQFESLGGTAATSGGGCLAVGTPQQAKQGIRDTPDLAFADWIGWGGGAADEVWARFYIEHSLHDLIHWTEGHGVRWMNVNPQEGNSVPRWHRPEGNGFGLMAALVASMQRREAAEVILHARADSLVIEGARVAGVRATDTRSGAPIEVRAPTVIVATGGFCTNLEMVLEAKPELRKYKILEGSGRGATGIGHKLVASAGGTFTHMEDIWFYVYATPDYRDPKGMHGLVFRNTPGYIWVNQQGRRFHDETRSGGATGTPALLRQSPPHAWAIIDRPMAAVLRVGDPYYEIKGEPNRTTIEELLDNSPYIGKATTLETLARRIEVDVTTFTAEVARYNRAFDQGLTNEPDFGRPLKDAKRIDTAPFYAIQLFPISRKNLGGVKTDLQCRVLDRHFEPIRGLYAAGEVAGMAGGHINGKAGLEGTMLGPALFSGRVAGAWAAHAAGHGPGFVGKPNR